MLEEDKWYEECSTCEGYGFYSINDEPYICDACDAQGYVEHFCIDDMVEDYGD